MSKNLMIKSKSAFLLALELFNKPTIEYRTESFSILFSNAFELLLKAYLYEGSGGKNNSIFYRKKPGQKRKSLTIDDCLRRVFTSPQDPLRNNIEYISEIRNESSHLIIPELDPYFSRVFQRGVLNYIECLDKWFGIKIIKEFTPGLISLVTSRESLKGISVLKEKMSGEDFKSIKYWIERFRGLEKIGGRATIPIHYTVALVRNPKKADIVLSSGKLGKGVGAIIMEKYRDPDTTHPFRMRDVIERVNKNLKGVKINPHDFQSYCFARGVRKSNRNDYFWKSKYGSSQFSGKIIEEMVSFYNADPKNRKRVREQYYQYLKKRGWKGGGRPKTEK